MNTFTICNKELQSYFRSPIAYTVIALWALIGGFFFYFGLSFFVQRSMESAMTGQAFPMDVNEWIVTASALERERGGAVPDPDDHHAAVRRGKTQRHD